MRRVQVVLQNKRIQFLHFVQICPDQIVHIQHSLDLFAFLIVLHRSALLKLGGLLYAGEDSFFIQSLGLYRIFAHEWREVGHVGRVDFSPGYVFPHQV